MKVRLIESDGLVRERDAPYPAEPFLSLATFEGTYGKVSGIWRIRWYRRVFTNALIFTPEYEYMFTHEFDHYEL